MSTSPVVPSTKPNRRRAFGKTSTEVTRQADFGRIVAAGSSTKIQLPLQILEVDHHRKSPKARAGDLARFDPFCLRTFYAFPCSRACAPILDFV